MVGKQTFCEHLYIYLSSHDNKSANSHEHTFSILCSLDVLWIFDANGNRCIGEHTIYSYKILYKKQKEQYEKTEERKWQQRFVGFWNTFWLIITSSIIALPNRFIPIDDTKVITGKVVDKTKWKLLSKTTGGWQNYVKIKIDGEDTFFWYNLDYENKEYGTRCLISERKGIWGLRYVTNVDFIVE